MRAFPQHDEFDFVVAENGALIYSPEDAEEQALAAPPPREFVDELRGRGVSPVGVGRVIVATLTPHDSTVLEVIRRMRLELQIVFNKEAVMVLPDGINKATGLRAALDKLGCSTRNTIAVGDAENDEALLTACGVSAAVANAVPAIKELADVVLQREDGHGVVDLIGMLQAGELHQPAHDANRGPRRSAGDL